MASKAAGAIIGEPAHGTEHPALVWVVLLASGLLYGLTVTATPARLAEHDALIAVMSLARDGALPFASGGYDLNALLSSLASSAVQLGGEPPLAVVRLPSILATALAAAWMFVWLWHHEGNAAALTATLLFATSGWALESAHSSQVNALQTLLVLVAATWVFDAARAASGATRRRIAAAALLLIAFQLQPTAAVAALALLIWCLPGGLRAAVDQHFARRTLLLLIGAVFIAGLLLVITPFVFAVVRADLFNAARDHALTGEVWFSLRDLWVQAPLLVALLPVAMVFAVRRSSSLAALALVMIAVPLIVHAAVVPTSRGACAYVFPFLAIIYGLALATPLERLQARISDDRSAGGGDMRIVQGLAAILLVLFGSAVTIMVNPTYRHTANVVQKTTDTMVRLRRPALMHPRAPWSDHAAVMPLSAGRQLKVMWRQQSSTVLPITSRRAPMIAASDAPFVFAGGHKG